MPAPRIYEGIVLGFALILVLAFLLDKLGDVMYKKGLARPFYLRGHRIHHRDVLLLVLPAGYTCLVSLFLLGLVKVVWHVFWAGIETTFFLAAGCLLLDLALDWYSLGLARRTALHHELVYLLIPAYVFTHILTIIP